MEREPRVRQLAVGARRRHEPRSSRLWSIGLLEALAGVLMMCCLLYTASMVVEAQQPRTVDAEELTDDLEDGRLFGLRFEGSDFSTAVEALASQGKLKSFIMIDECEVDGALLLGFFAETVSRTDSRDTNEVGPGDAVQGKATVWLVDSKIKSVMTGLASGYTSLHMNVDLTELPVIGWRTLWVRDCEIELLDMSWSAFEGHAAVEDSSVERLYVMHASILEDLRLANTAVHREFAFQECSCAGNVIFTSCSLGGWVIWAQSSFGGVILANTAIGGDIQVIGVSAPPEQLAALYMKASEGMESSLRRRADEYYRRARRLTRSELPLMQRVAELVVADWISAYGTSWTRVLLSWFAVIGVSGLLLWVFKGIEDGAGQRISSLWLSLYFSVVSFTTLGYGDYRAHKGWKALACLVSLLGATLMAVFIGVFARAYLR